MRERLLRDANSRGVAATLKNANVSIQDKTHAIFAVLFLVISTSGGAVLFFINMAKKDAAITDALGRQRMLSQQMVKSVVGQSMAKNRKKTIEQQILSLDEYITQMREIYTRSVIVPAKKSRLEISMTPESVSHPTIPFPATFTRMVNEKLDEEHDFSVEILAEIPVNPRQNLKSDMDRQANAFLKKSPNTVFTKVTQKNENLYLTLYSPDKATTKACVTCHSAFNNSVRIGDILGIRKYEILYSDNIAVGRAELEANLDEYHSALKTFEEILSVVKAGGSIPNHVDDKKQLEISAVSDLAFQNKLVEIDRQLSSLKKAVEIISNRNIDSTVYRQAQEDVLVHSNSLNELSGELVSRYTQIADKNYQNIQLAVILSVLLTLLVLIGVALYTSRMIITPVRSISTVLREMANGKLKQNILPVEQNDEIGMLNQSLNDLMLELDSFTKYSQEILNGNIHFTQFDVGSDFNTSLHRMLAQAREKQDAEVKLRAAQKNLEFKVQERTSELLKSNNSLKTEIAKRQVAEKSLRSSQERARMILNSAHNAFISIDASGKILEWNIQAEKTFGWSRTEAIGQKLTDLIIPAAEREAHINGIKKFLETGTSKILNTSVELTAQHKDGHEFPVETSITPLRYKDSYHFNAFIQDISERKLMQTQLNHAQKMESIGQLAAGIAHEINTPMQFIGDNTRFLQESFDELIKLGQLLDEWVQTEKQNGNAEANIQTQVDDLDYLTEEIPKAIEQSLEGVDRVSRIVKAMKEFSHPGSEEKKFTNINKCIETTITIARNEWKYVAEVIQDFDPDLPDVPCFANDFNQVILNTIVNAAHAIEAAGKAEDGNKGEIRVTTRKQEETIEIRIQDNGTGIPEKVKARIFDPFFTTKDVGKGTGQGLAIVHTIIVKKHNGTVDLETEEGKGSTFIFRLPLAASTAANAGSEHKTI